MARQSLEKKRPISMADVAREAGVSQQTVSRVANGLSNVNEDTRLRVQAAMAKLGFRPNFAGRSLRSGQYNSVGLCLYDVREFGNLATLDGILSAAREHGYAITMIENVDDNLSLKDVSHKITELPVDGMIISMSLMASDFDSFKPQPGMGTVLLSMYEHPYCTTVESDQYGCSWTVVEYLKNAGHRNIRFVAGPSYSIDSNFRQKGWEDALSHFGLPVAQPLAGNWLADSGYEIGCKLSADTEMTAIYSANDQMAFGIIAALQDRGIRVPEDVSVVGVDDSLEGYVPHCNLTTIRFDLLKRGRTAFEHALLGRKPGYTPETVRIPGRLIVRDTVRNLH
ncbi:MAG: LacI family DNA-binding transcriptional regulator [Atopobiaceae bacterium]|nr:LacI family DNA-binding transcriptional regulator [Atopobiaceae bacterium]